MKYTIRHIAEILGGTFIQYFGDSPVEHLLLDSRRLIFPDTSLFFSLKGPRRDGQTYLDELYKRGVRNFVVQDPGGLEKTEREGQWEAFPQANIILVTDTLAALQQLAAWHRSQFSIPVIGITGSNGKTIVKEWLNELLEDRYHIIRSPKSYNSQIGVPLSVWPLNESHELAIFEAGISRPGEMGRLEAILRPEIGIFTNIGEAHSEGFHSIREKAVEKCILFREARVIIYCRDQPETVAALQEWLRARRLEAAWEEKAGREQKAEWTEKATREEKAGREENAGSGEKAGQRNEEGRVPGSDEVTGMRPGGQKGWEAPEFFSWGRAEGSTLRVSGLVKKEVITTIRVGYQGMEFDFSIPFTDEASIENILHCFSTLLYLGQSPEQVIRKLPGISPIAMRLELKSGINHCSIINDSYSADLSSLQIALDFLAQQQQHRKRTVILSDIPESGLEEGALYEAVARGLQQKKVDRLIGIGSHISGQEGVIRQWFAGETVFYSSVDHFKRDLHPLHFRDETILLKGARVFEFEQIDRLLSEQIHQTVLEINLNAMAENLRQYRQLLDPGTRVMAMVKAFAYGSGSFEIANLLQFHRVDYLGVAYADEGAVLRRGGIGIPVMVMNTEDSGFDSLVQYNLEPVIYSMALLRSFDKWLKKEGILQFPVHIELETGMNRLGFPLDQMEELAGILKNTAFKVQSVFSHLAASEEAQQDEFTLMQAAKYRKAADILQGALPYPFLRHIANSAGIIRHASLRMDMVRLGIGLYGIDSANAHLLSLQEVSTLKSTIAQIKYPEEGETVGYNRKGVAVRGTVIATVRIGYADGYPRRLGNGAGKMWVRGRLAPVIGSVCMDMTMIDITGIPDVREGDTVIVFGNELSVSQLAQWAQTIPYEILTGVSQRVRRVYFEE